MRSCSCTSTILSSAIATELPMVLRGHLAIRNALFILHCSSLMLFSMRPYRSWMVYRLCMLTWLAINSPRIFCYSIPLAARQPVELFLQCLDFGFGIGEGFLEVFDYPSLVCTRSSASSCMSLLLLSTSYCFSAKSATSFLFCFCSEWNALTTRSWLLLVSVALQWCTSLFLWLWSSF